MSISKPPTTPESAPPDASDPEMTPYRESSLPDGKEPAPKGVAIAAIVRWVLLLLMAAIAVFTIWKFWGPGAHVASSETHAADRYYCPMHPQIRSSEPGECPICHMNLEPIPQERRGGADAGAAVATPTSDAGMNAMPGMVMPVSADAGDAAASTASTTDAALQGVVPVTITSERQQLIGVAEVRVARRAIGGTLRVPGTSEAPQTALSQVHVRVPGFLERVAVQETGVRVTRGQTLAWMYSPQIYQVEQELLTAHAWTAGAPMASSAPGAQNADVEVAARRSLALLGLSDGDIDHVLRTRTPMRDVPIRAPASGFVTQRSAILGMYAQPETVLYEIADLTRIWVVASVFERDLPRIRRGMPARFVPSDTPDAPLDGRVDLVEPELSVSTRTARVRLEFSNPQLRLRPGQFGDVTFDLPAATDLVVPRDAVIDTGQQQYVYVDTGQGRFEPRRVHAGPLVDDQIQILDGVREGENVVTRGNFMLDSESRLQASLLEAPAPTAPTPTTGGGDTGPNCETDFDRQRFPDRYAQCRACERVHRGMGSMEADCKNAIPRPWR